jgi:phosphonopyruvate decarboxylase
MLSREEALKTIFDLHGEDAIYVTNTGYMSRAVYAMYPDNDNILYMQGSMGLSPCIALGVALNSFKTVVALVGDGSLLMHLGATHTLRDEAPSNLFVYVLDNRSHESVGGYRCAPLEEEYPGITKIFSITKGDKKDRVGIDCKTNLQQIKERLKHKYE